MKSLLRLTVVLIGILLPIGFAHAAPTTAPSNTRWAQYVIEIVKNPTTPSLNDIESQVDKIAAELSPAILNISREQLPQFFSVKPQSSDSEIQLTLTCEIPATDGLNADVRPAAREFVDRVTRGLEMYLDADRAGTSDWINSRRAAANEAREQAEAVRKQMLSCSNYCERSPVALMSRLPISMMPS